VGPRAGLDAVPNRKIPSPRRESNPDHPIVNLAKCINYALFYVILFPFSEVKVGQTFTETLINACNMIKHRTFASVGFSMCTYPFVTANC
jgi:hypothetical protein